MTVVESLWEIVVVDGLSGVIWLIVVTNLSKSIIRIEARRQRFRHMIFTIAWMSFAEVAYS